MFEGLMPALITPFDEEGELDLRAMEAVVERHIEAGVDGISALGSTGEFSHLDGDERRRFAEAIVEMIDGRVPLIVGVGTTGTREAVDLARHAASIGANGVLSVSPYYWKVGEEALFKHFVTVAESVEIPTLVYNFPMLTGIDLSPTLLARLARECPSIVGVKDTVKEYMHTVNVLNEVKPVRPDFAVLVGFEDQILPALLAGADGSICGLSNIAPELFVGLVRTFEVGDLAEAARLHRRVLHLMAMYALSDPGLGATKLAMKKLGVPISPTVRGPALPVPPESEEAIDAALEA
ncbi:MAG: 4-hydroxy-tetrahydrodipicolinate synthase, partial [Rubrobacteraceae bacterium]|nr:4-hydroxy-tetrahydrodipicolinate synthase [Rubrobacteraceae bacterium]